MTDSAATWQIVSAVATAFAAIATAVYAYLVWRTLLAMQEQRREMHQQRLDSLRPAVIPVGPSETIAYRESIYAGEEDRKQLTLRNNGPGPAFNVVVSVGLRRDDGTLDHEALLGEFYTGAPDMAAKELGTVVQWTKTEGFTLANNQVLTVTYDDVYGRHFRTTCYRKVVGWLAEEIEEIPQRSPRINWDAKMGLG